MVVMWTTGTGNIIQHRPGNINRKNKQTPFHYVNLFINQTENHDLPYLRKAGALYRTITARHTQKVHDGWRPGSRNIEGERWISLGLE